MAVGAYVWDDAPPPPELSRALNYQSWGIADVMNLPAGLLPRMNTTIAYYNALAGHRKAGIWKTKWIENNPDAWDLVTRMMNWRREEHANRNK